MFVKMVDYFPNLLLYDSPDLVFDFLLAEMHWEREGERPRNLNVCLEPCQWKPPEWTSSEVDSKRDQNQYFLYVKSISFAPFIAEENSSSSYQTFFFF